MTSDNLYQLRVYQVNVCLYHISLLQAHVLSTDTHSVKISSNESAVANPTAEPIVDLSKIPDKLGENVK